MEARAIELLPLASKIAREFSNIPGLAHPEIELAAQEALAHAARLFDPAKGDFTAYAARAMRNTLCDLFERQVRHHHHHVYDLDLPVTQSATTPEVRLQQVPARDKPLADQAAALESSKRLEQAMKTLSARLRLVAEGNENPVPIRDRMPGLDKNLAAVIDKALVRNPKDRFPDAGKLLAAIR